MKSSLNSALNYIYMYNLLNWNVPLGLDMETCHLPEAGLYLSYCCQLLCAYTRLVPLSKTFYTLKKNSERKKVFFLPAPKKDSVKVLMRVVCLLYSSLSQSWSKRRKEQLEFEADLFTWVLFFEVHRWMRPEMLAVASPVGLQ